jgi:hypothetical protein
MKLSVYAALILGQLLIVTSLFYASWSEFVGNPAVANNLDMRYMSFGFPLLFMIAFAAVNTNFGNRTRSHLVYYIAVTAGVLLVTNSRLTGYNLINPEIQSYFFNKYIFWALLFSLLIILLVYLAKPRYGLLLFMLIYIPAYLGVSSYHVYQNILKTNLSPNLYDTGGLLLHNLSIADTDSKYLVIAPNKAHIFRASFQQDDIYAYGKVLKEGSVIDLLNTPTDFDFLLAMGNYYLNGKSFKLVNKGGSLFARIGYTIDLSQPKSHELDYFLRGRLALEGKGYYLQDLDLDLEFLSPLPESFKVLISVINPEESSEKFCQIFVEGSISEFDVGSSNEHIIPIHNPLRSKLLKLKCDNSNTYNKTVNSSYVKIISLRLVISPRSNIFDPEIFYTLAKPQRGVD